LFALNGSAAYAWNARHRSTLAASWSMQQLNLTFDPTIPANVLEPLNSNSDTARLAFDHGYQIDDVDAGGTRAGSGVMPMLTARPTVRSLPPRRNGRWVDR
jgi:hypothetical protein